MQNTYIISSLESALRLRMTLFLSHVIEVAVPDVTTQFRVTKQGPLMFTPGPLRLL
jgi:hypothetical protein